MDMNAKAEIASLRIGMIGSGFIAKFHLQALVEVRHVAVTGVFSPTPAHREALARETNERELGPCLAYDSLEAMLTSGGVDTAWLLGPNFARLDTMRVIHRLVKQGRTKLVAIACEKPLARTLADDYTEAERQLIIEALALLGRLTNKPLEKGTRE